MHRKSHVPQLHIFLLFSPMHIAVYIQVVFFKSYHDSLEDQEQGILLENDQIFDALILG